MGRWISGLAVAAWLVGIVPSPARAKDEAAPAAAPAEAASAKADRNVDIVFALDTTGSMGGLIAGAKGKIWLIVNEMAKAKPSPQIRIGLVGYRDRGEEYVTKIHDLTDDLDGMYKNLQDFQAAGGGDGPEHVLKGLADAIRACHWSDDKDALKVIFLVGDAPPHTDYRPDAQEQDVPTLAGLCEEAIRKGILINTIRCGGDAETERVWQDVAVKSEGRYTSIDQSGGVVAVSTPMDKEIAELSGAVASTVVAYGEAGARRDLREKADDARKIAEGAPPEAAADRATFLAKRAEAAEADGHAGGAMLALAALPAAPGATAGGGGAGDLLDEIESKTVTLETVKEEALPEEMRKMTAEERKAFVEKKRAERDAARKRLGELVREREKYLEAERAKAGPTGFDAEVLKAVKEQAAKKGLKFE